MRLIAEQVQDILTQHNNGRTLSQIVAHITEDQTIARAAEVSKLYIAYLELHQKTGDLEEDIRRRIRQLDIVSQLTKLLKPFTNP
jgi:hypothetical protein